MKACIRKTSWYKHTWFGFDKEKKSEPPCDNATFDTEMQRWFVDVNTIDDLLNLAHEIVLSNALEGDDYDAIIEIYDDYRE